MEFRETKSEKPVNASANSVARFPASPKGKREIAKLKMQFILLAAYPNAIPTKHYELFSADKYLF